MPAVQIRKLTSSPLVDPELLARVIKAAYEVKAEREARDVVDQELAERSSSNGHKPLKLNSTPTEIAIEPASSPSNHSASNG